MKDAPVRFVCALLLILLGVLILVGVDIDPKLALGGGALLAGVGLLT